MFTNLVRKFFSKYAVNNWLLLLIVAGSLPGTAQSEIYLEIGLEGGGETFVTATRSNDDFSFDQDLNIGGGVKIAAGIHKIVGENDGGSVSLALGYLWDSIDADNGDADFSTITLDAIYNLRLNRHRLGIGASYHIGPEYQDDLDGFAKTNIDFDDSLGLILQYSYEITPGFYLGLRHTEMDYEVHGNSVDASSIGLFLAYTGE